jgi:uncharacterized protein (DUF433 family)
VAPDLHHGEPCIKGTRVPVAMIVGSLADGMSWEEVLAAYPQLELDDIRAALAYAAETVRCEWLVPFAVEAPWNKGGRRLACSGNPDAPR